MDHGKITISRDDDIYECFPDVVRTSNENLICVYRESEDLVPKNFTRIVLTRSNDGGRIWGDRSVLAEPVDPPKVYPVGTAPESPSWVMEES